ncbi:6632_t:CDS:2, partial [Dentiscutata erythropus]
MPGWGDGYRGDSRNIFCHSGSGKSYGPLFTMEISRNGSVEINFGCQSFSYKTFTDYDIEDEILQKNLNRALDMRNYESL